MAAPLPLAKIVGNAIPVAVPVTGGAQSTAPAPNADEVEYYMTLFEHYTQEQITKELESSKKSRVAAALAVAATRGKAFLDKFFKKKVEAGEAQGVGEMLETALLAQDTAKPSVAARMQATASTAAASAYEALTRFYTWASAKVAEGGPVVKEWASKAADAFVAMGGIIKAAWGRIDLNFLKNTERIGIIHARYGEVVLPGAPAFNLKLNSNTNRYFLVDRYKEFKKPDLKAALTKFSSKYSLSNATKVRLEGIVKKIILEQADGRYVKSRYNGDIKQLISANALAKIKAGKTTLVAELAKIKPPRLNGNRVVRLNSRYGKLANVKFPKISFPSLPGRPAAPPPLTPGRTESEQNSNSKIMSNAAFQQALAELVQHHSLGNVRSIIEQKAVSQGSINSAKEYIARLKGMSSKTNVLKNIYGVRFNNQTRLEDLLAMRTRGNWSRLHPNLKKQVNDSLRNKLYRRGSSMNSGNFDYPTLSSVMRALNSAETVGNVPGATTYVESLKRAINRLGSRTNSIRVNENRLARIAGAVRGVRKVTSVTNAIRNAQGRIARLRREENSRRRERGLAPLAPSSRNYGSYNNRGSSRIPVYPQNIRPPTYGNMRPAFGPQPNRPQPGVVPIPPPLQPFSAIPANNRGRQAPPPPMPNMRPENLLPPTEAAAVTNAGGVNRALNLVENAGGVTSVAKTANILKNVGNNPNAAVAAGASPKNVKIVLQLGGANNALKVASAVPKLKKRRRSKKTKKTAKPKSPRVKEIKKLIKFLGSKNELVKKLPDPENKEKKLTKNQVVSKITRYLLRKGK